MRKKPKTVSLDSPNPLPGCTFNKLDENKVPVLFSGNQDNGVQRYTGTPAWNEVSSGDSGAGVINAGNDQQVLCTYTSNQIWRSDQGGKPDTFNIPYAFPLSANDRVNMYAPLRSGNIADRVGFGTRKPWLSVDFGKTWNSLPDGNDHDLLAVPISAMIFAEDGKTMWVGLNNGQVWRLTEGTPWLKTRLDDQGPGPLSDFIKGRAIPVTSIAVDPVNSTSLYLTLGGNMVGDNNGWQRVWHFDSAKTQWGAASGPDQIDPAALFNVQFNAIVGTDNGAGQGCTLYAGADIGIWRSLDSGKNWAPFGEGLPEASVIDLAIYEKNEARKSPPLLRASTYGRGVYERVLVDKVADNPRVFANPVQLYLRATPLDRGLYDAQDKEPNPARDNHQVSIRDAAAIAVSKQDKQGAFPLPLSINYYQFSYKLKNQAFGLPADKPVRVYVEANNRGILPGDGVQVMVLLSDRFQIPPLPAVPGTPKNPFANLKEPPNLPDAYQTNIQKGSFLVSPHWNTIHLGGVNHLTASSPAVIGLDIPAAKLRQSGVYAVLIFITSPDDPVTSTETNVEKLVISDSKAAMQYLRIP